MTNDRSLKSILLLAANPKSTTALRLQEEEREIKERLRLSGYGKVPVNSVVALRPRDIQQALLDFRPQVVHFSGHGANQQGLVFEDNIGNVKLIDSDALAQLFNLFSNRVECVVLNACYSATQAEAIAKHISYVVGMNTAIGDNAAIEFSVGFYAALGAGETFEFAYKMGCISIRLAGVQGTCEHLTPELLKRESQVLDSSFNLEDTQEQDDFSNYDNDKKINTRTKHFRSSFRVSPSMREIRVIGPRNSGKTTFLAALADWHDIGFRKPIKAVEPLNEETLDLRRNAAHILRDGRQFSPTYISFDNYYLPSYFLNIEITPNFWHNPLCWLRRQNIQFSILDFGQS